MSRRLLLVCASVAAFYGTAAIATLSSSTSSETDKLAATFTNELAKIDKAHDSAVAALRDQYVVALVALERKFTSAGSLDSVLAVKKESTRVGTDRSLRPGDLVAEPPDLLSLQQQYIKKFDALPVDRAGKVVRLADLYAKSLRTLEENLTKQSMLDDAIAVRRIREGVPALPAVTGASFLLSTVSQTVGEGTNATSATEAKTGPAVPAQGITSQATNASPRSDRKVAKKYTGTSASRIRDQFNVFWKAIQKQNWEGAVEVMDPAGVKTEGARRMEGFARVYGSRFTGDNPNLRSELRNLEVATDDRTARSTPRVWVLNDWQEMRPLHWVQTEGDWYINVQATVSEQRPDATREERREERRWRQSR